MNMSLPAIMARLERTTNLSQGEMCIILKEMVHKVNDLETKLNAELEKPKPSGRGSSKVPARKIPST